MLYRVKSSLLYGSETWRLTENNKRRVEATEMDALRRKGKIQGGIEVTGRRGRRRRNLLDDLKERRGYSHLKEEALDRTVWRARFGRGFGPVVRQTAKWMDRRTHQFSLWRSNMIYVPHTKCQKHYHKTWLRVFVHYR